MGQSDLTLFPYCNCDYSQQSSSYYVMPHVQFTPPSTYTFTLALQTCARPNNRCCKADLQKFEMAICEFTS